MVPPIGDAKTPNEIAPKRRTKSRQNAERLTMMSDMLYNAFDYERL